MNRFVVLNVGGSGEGGGIFGAVSGNGRHLFLYV